MILPLPLFQSPLVTLPVLSEETAAHLGIPPSYFEDELFETWLKEDLEHNFLNIEKLYLEIVNLKHPQKLELQTLIDKLDQLEIFGENPLKYWDNNRVQCYLEILNPNYIIKTANIEANNLDREDFNVHIKELLDLGLIQKSISPHRFAAFIVRNHSEQKRGKSRMVINYKRLNDNTLTDSYLIPDKNQLINKIQNRKIFSKFDCKSGFWQVKMHPDSIPWTTFSCPEGHYEWLVMPFGLKIAPSIFQRKMDTIFKNMIPLFSFILMMF